MSRSKKNRRKKLSPSGSKKNKRVRRRDKKSIVRIVSNWLVSWFQTKHPIFRFVLLFGFLMTLFYVASRTPLFRNTLFPSYLCLNAEISNVILRLFHQETTVSGASIFSSLFSLEIALGCDAVEASALVMSAILAFPTPFLTKLAGIIVGTLFLQIMNLVRIVTLFLIGVYYPQAFRIMHIDVWQAIFIIIAILFWIFWALWAIKSKMSEQNVPN